MQFPGPKSASTFHRYVVPITYAAAVWLFFTRSVHIFECLSTTLCAVLKKKSVVHALRYGIHSSIKDDFFKVIKMYVKNGCTKDRR